MYIYYTYTPGGKSNALFVIQALELSMNHIVNRIIDSRRHLLYVYDM